MIFHGLGTCACVLSTQNGHATNRLLRLTCEIGLVIGKRENWEIKIGGVIIDKQFA